MLKKKQLKKKNAFGFSSVVLQRNALTLKQSLKDKSSTEVIQEKRIYENF